MQNPLQYSICANDFAIVCLDSFILVEHHELERMPAKLLSRVAEIGSFNAVSAREADDVRVYKCLGGGE